ncbi:MAG: hypothetical protein JSS54_12945 [Proteobacteria bacterium]|nr:hypothetical protein [Pseudomonadota bacterium]
MQKTIEMLNVISVDARSNGSLPSIQQRAAAIFAFDQLLTRGGLASSGRVWCRDRSRARQQTGRNGQHPLRLLPGSGRESHRNIFFRDAARLKQIVATGVLDDAIDPPNGSVWAAEEKIVGATSHPLKQITVCAQNFAFVAKRGGTMPTR